MLIRSKHMSYEELAILRDLLTWPQNAPALVGGKQGDILFIDGLESGDWDGKVVVKLSFDDDRGIDVEYLKIVLSHIGAAHMFSFADEASGAVRKLVHGFNTPGAIAAITDGTRYELEGFSTSRWGINVYQMPGMRFRTLLALLDGMTVNGKQVGIVRNITATESLSEPQKFSFALHVRHQHGDAKPSPADEMRRKELSAALGITLEWAKPLVRV